MRAQFKQRTQDFTALQNALQSGDLADAQKAFASFQQDIKGSGQASGRHHHHGAGQNGQLTKDVAALQDALQTGDVTSAQKAFATFQKDIQNLRNARQAQHSRPTGNDGDADDAGQSASTAVTAGTGSQPLGNTLNVQA